MSGDGFLFLIIIGLALAAVVLTSFAQWSDEQDAKERHIERTTKK